MILFMAALSNIPRELLETADVEGAGPVRKFFYIKIRYLSPTLLFVTILSLINSFKVFREIYLLTGDYPYGNLYMLQHFMNNIFRSLDYQRLAAAAVVMTIAMVIIILVLFITETVSERMWKNEKQTLFRTHRPVYPFVIFRFCLLDSDRSYNIKLIYDTK